MSFAKSLKSLVPLTVDGTINLHDIIHSEGLVEYVVAEPNQASTIGLIRFEDGSFVTSVNSIDIINVGQSVKKVNAKKVKRLLKEELQKLSKEYEIANPGKSRKFNKEEKADIQGMIVQSLLPETEVDEFQNYLIHDTVSNQAYVINSNKKASENITAFVRSVIGSFPVLPMVKDELDVIEGFSDLANGKITTRLSLGNYIKLEDTEGVVTWTKESLYESKATDLIDSGKQVVAIGLEFDGTVKFVVDTEFSIKGIKFDKSFTQEGDFAGDVLLCIKEMRSALEDLKKETFDK